MAKKDEIVEEDKPKMRIVFRKCQFSSKGSGACVNSSRETFNRVPMHEINDKDCKTVAVARKVKLSFMDSRLLDDKSFISSCTNQRSFLLRYS